MTTKHPATPLPWMFDDARGAIRVDAGGHQAAPHLAHLTVRSRDGDGSYLAHAANAYPKLVEALRKMLFLAAMEGPADETPVQTDAVALLRELGEDA